MVLKELIFNSFYFGKGLSCLESTDFLTAFTLKRCGCLDSTNF